MLFRWVITIGFSGWALAVPPLTGPVPVFADVGDDDTPAATVDFDSQIVPLLTKVGCNAGACHGAAAGRGGFHLSLFGADPDADYRAMVQEFQGRRIHLRRPDFSLLLRKPTGELEHGGGVLLSSDDPLAVVLRQWIAAGAPRGSSPSLTDWSVSPQRQTLPDVPARVPLRSLARFDDGPLVDVTGRTTFHSHDPSALVVDEDGVAEIRRPGQHVVVARFMDRVQPLQWNVPWSATPIDLSGEPRWDEIDRYVFAALEDLRLPLSPPAADAIWLRRVHLDLTGRLPPAPIVTAFLDDPDPDKLQREVDRLLASPAFADFWTLRFSRLLRMRSQPNDLAGFQAYADWLRGEIQRDAGLDQMAAALLTAAGDAHQVGPANFSRMAADPRAEAELVGLFFAGVRLGCANCHDHPLDRWTQEDYHGLAAILAPWDRSRHVAFTGRGSVTNPKTGQAAIPRLPGLRDLPPGANHRQEVVRWVLDTPDRPLARATVNRLWRWMFGRGLVEPPDDLSQSNPPTHPELLDYLVQDFVDNGYRIRWTLRKIALSRTYASTSQPTSGNQADDRFYSRAYRRPLEPEVLVDAISDVTGVPQSFPAHGVDRAVLVWDAARPAPPLEVLGRCDGGQACAASESAGPGATETLTAQLHLLNGPLINQKLRDPDGWLERQWQEGRTLSEIIQQGYLRGLGRRPTPAEWQHWESLVQSADPERQRQRMEDFVWSLLNSRDFRQQH